MPTHSSSGTSLAGLETVSTDLRAMVGPDHLHPATPQDTVDGMLPQLIIEPGTADELARALKTATTAGLHVIPRGGNTKCGWGNPPRDADLIISTRRLNRVIEHAWADMTATVEVGCTFQQLQQTLAQRGQRLALDPLWPERATIGGILATNDSGSLRTRFGSLRDLIIGITLALPNGTLAKSGGKVVKNVAGYDLPKLATGSLGTLGIITEAIFRLHPIPREGRSLTFSMLDTAAMNLLILAILDSKLVPTGLQVRAGSSSPMQIDLRFEGTATGCDAQCEQVLHMTTVRSEPAKNVWSAAASLWTTSAEVVICKFSVLPADLATLLEKIKQLTDSAHLAWSLVAQAIGVGFLRLESADAAILLPLLQNLREALESHGGSLCPLRAPLDLKRKIGVWGSPGDALQLMRNIKQQFDPTGTLNPGRFIGGI
jgi:glycolate oxidase FAD binding subunit